MKGRRLPLTDKGGLPNSARCFTCGRFAREWDSCGHCQCEQCGRFCDRRAAYAREPLLCSRSCFTDYWESWGRARSIARGRCGRCGAIAHADDCPPALISGAAHLRPASVARLQKAGAM